MSLPPVDAPFTLEEDDGVFEAHFKTINATTLDHYFQQLEAIFDRTPSDQTVAIMLYSGSSMPAVQDMAARDRRLRAKYERVPFVRLAIMYDQQSHFALINFMMRIVNLNRHMALRTFHEKDRDAALSWLRR